MVISTNVLNVKGIKFSLRGDILWVFLYYNEEHRKGRQILDLYDMKGWYVDT